MKGEMTGTWVVNLLTVPIPNLVCLSCYSSCSIKLWFPPHIWRIAHMCSHYKQVSAKWNIEKTCLVQRGGQWKRHIKSIENDIHGYIHWLSMFPTLCWQIITLNLGGPHGLLLFFLAATHFPGFPASPLSFDYTVDSYISPTGLFKPTVFLGKPSANWASAFPISLLSHNHY